MSWYDENELIAFPLVGDDDFAIPPDVIADVLIHAPAALGGQAVVTSLSVTGIVVSIVISIGGSPAGFVTVENTPDLVQVPQEIQPVAAGVSGTVTFGSGITRHRLRVDGAYALVDASLIRFDVDLTNPTAILGGTDLFGRVALQAGDGYVVEPRELRIQKEDTSVVTVTAAVIGLAEGRRLEPLNPCEVSAETAELQAPPVREVNGVSPDAAGNIDVVALTVQLDPAEGVVTLTSPVTARSSSRTVGEPCE